METTTTNATTKTTFLIADDDAYKAVVKLVNKTNNHLTDKKVVILDKEYVDRTFTYNFKESIYSRPSFVEKIEKRVIQLSVEYPSFNDWTLVAKIDYNKGIIPTDMTKELIFKNKEHGLSYYKCDSCGHKVRKESFVIENVHTGEELQVGKECLKSYGINGMELLSKFICNLNKYLVFRDGEYVPYSDHNYVSTDSIIRPTEEVFTACLDYYKANDGKWIKAEWNSYTRTYSRSESSSAIKLALMNNEVGEVDKEYFEKVKAYTLEKFSHFETDEEVNADDFEYLMYKAFSNFYWNIGGCHYLFFAIRNYENYLKELANPKPFKLGDQLHIVGKVVSTKYCETAFGSAEINTITASKYTFERFGKVERDADKNINVFARVKFFKKDGTIGLDRCTKNPKKGLAVIEL